MSKLAQNASSSLLLRFRAREIPYSSKSTAAASLPNPFLPRLNPSSGRWAPAKYSLRRQAELIKDAKRQNALHLLPPGPKNAPTPVTLVNKHGAATSPILSLLNPTAQLRTTVDPTAAATEDPEVQWIGEPKPRTSFGLYGKRRKMFKGHKWEKQVQLRKAYMERVVAQIDSQKANMRWGRARKGKKPRSKYPL